MAKLPLDLKQFVKTGEDKTMTTLKHKAGHEIKIAHGALSPEMQKSLKSLPLYDGGTVEKFADGGEVAIKKENYKKMADGGAVSEDEQKKQAPVVINVGQQAPVAAPMPEATPIPQMPAMMPSQINKVPEQQEILPGVPASQVYAPPAAKQEEPTLLPEGAIPAPVASEAPQAQAPQAPMPTGPSASNVFDNAVMSDKNAINNEAMAIGKQGQAEAKALQEQQVLQGNLIKDRDARVKKYEADFERMTKDIDAQHIDPNRFMGNMATGEKISNAIGLFLGGLSASTQGGVNPALKMLDTAIARDIDAQKADLGKKENLLSANMKHFGNLEDAAKMTEAQIAGLTINKLKIAEANAKTPIAKARAQQAISELYMTKVVPNLQAAATNQTMASLMSMVSGRTDKAEQAVNAIEQLDPKKGAELRERLVPGYGVASVKPTEKDRTALNSISSTMSGLKELQALAVKKGPTIKWSEDDMVNQTKIVNLQLALKDAANLGVLSESDKKMLDQMVADPGQIRSSVAVKQLQATIDSIDTKKNNILKGLGLKDNSAPKPAMGEMREFGGAKYQKVDGGWKKVK
jgi:hypothetical protein